MIEPLHPNETNTTVIIKTINQLIHKSNEEEDTINSLCDVVEPNKPEESNDHIIYEDVQHIIKENMLLDSLARCLEERNSYREDSVSYKELTEEIIDIHRNLKIHRERNKCKI